MFCADTEDPGDAYLYVKVLHLLVLVREYYTEKCTMEDDEESLCKKAKDILATLLQLKK